MVSEIEDPEALVDRLHNLFLVWKTESDKPAHDMHVNCSIRYLQQAAFAPLTLSTSGHRLFVGPPRLVEGAIAKSSIWIISHVAQDNFRLQLFRHDQSIFAVAVVCTPYIAGVITQLLVQTDRTLI